MLPTIGDILTNLGVLIVGVLAGLVISFIITWWMRIIIIIILVLILVGVIALPGLFGI